MVGWLGESCESSRYPFQALHPFASAISLNFWKSPDLTRSTVRSKNLTRPLQSQTKSWNKKHKSSMIKPTKHLQHLDHLDHDDPCCSLSLAWSVSRLAELSKPIAWPRVCESAGAEFPSAGLFYPICPFIKTDLRFTLPPRIGKHAFFFYIFLIGTSFEVYIANFKKITYQRCCAL